MQSPSLILPGLDDRKRKGHIHMLYHLFV